MLQDIRVLTPEYAPQDLHHREGALNHLTGSLRPITAGNSGTPSMIVGPPGVGKTTIARFVAKRLKSENPEIKWCRVDCLNHSTPGVLLNHVCAELELLSEVPVAGTPRGTYYDRLRESGSQLVVILDEVTHCDDRSILTTLHDIDTVTPIYITTDEPSLLADLDGRAADRLRQAATVRLDPYSDGALVDILKARTDLALAPGSLESGVLEACADTAAGSARQAIELCRQAITHARDSGRGHVSVADVAAVEHTAHRNIFARRVADLGSHQRILSTSQSIAS